MRLLSCRCCVAGSSPSTLTTPDSRPAIPLAHLDRRRLAGPVRAKHCRHFPGSCGERDGVDGDHGRHGEPSDVRPPPQPQRATLGDGPADSLSSRCPIQPITGTWRGSPLWCLLSTSRQIWLGACARSLVPRRRSAPRRKWLSLSATATLRTRASQLRRVRRSSRSVDRTSR